MGFLEQGFVIVQCKHINCVKWGVTESSKLEYYSSIQTAIPLNRMLSFEELNLEVIISVFFSMSTV